METLQRLKDASTNRQWDGFLNVCGISRRCMALFE